MALRDKLLITGGVRLQGTVSVSGGKNSAVAIIPAALMADGESVIENLPIIEDVYILIKIMRELGAHAEFDSDKRTLYVDPCGLNDYRPSFDLARRLRASYYLVSVLLARFGKADVPFPGGCDIGLRPIDEHIRGLSTLGANIWEYRGYIYARAESLIGRDVYMNFPSVGATINIMIAAATAQGRTNIINAAREPHIVDLANFLNSMGARIMGAGTDTIRVRGVNRLRGTNYTVIPDQIETGTLMIAAAATHGDVTIRGCIPAHMDALSAKLLEMGIRVDTGDDTIRVRSDGNHRASNVKTQVYPGFPTDLQQPMTVLLSVANGRSEVTETIFESRFKYVNELKRMGADINVYGQVATINGVEQLNAAPIIATDLRAGAAMIVAGLIGSGVTEIGNVEYIDRGYENIEEKLTQLGAKIERKQVETNGFEKR